MVPTNKLISSEIKVKISTHNYRKKQLLSVVFVLTQQKRTWIRLRLSKTKFTTELEGKWKSIDFVVSEIDACAPVVMDAIQSDFWK